MNNIGTLRATRLFRFELFFLADTSNWNANSTSTAEIAMIEIRDLDIFDSPFAGYTVLDLLTLFKQNRCKPDHLSMVGQKDGPA